MTFTLSEGAAATLSVYDVLGREVARLVEGRLEAGRHTAVLDADALPSGAYLYRLRVGDDVRTGRITLLR